MKHTGIRYAKQEEQIPRKKKKRGSRYNMSYARFGPQYAKPSRIKGFARRLSIIEHGREPEFKDNWDRSFNDGGGFSDEKVYRKKRRSSRRYRK